MIATSPIDLALAVAGYLQWPGGHLQHIIGLDLIARDTLIAGCQPYWTSDSCPLPGYFCEHSRRIMLAPWLYWCPPFFLRDVWSHELGHAVTGHDQQQARAWQMQRYGDLLCPTLA